jgi:hypothetical protein
VGLIHLSQDMDYWRAVVNTIMKLQIPWKQGISWLAEQLFASQRLCYLELEYWIFLALKLEILSRNTFWRPIRVFSRWKKNPWIQVKSKNCTEKVPLQQKQSACCWGSYFVRREDSSLSLRISHAGIEITVFTPLLQKVSHSTVRLNNGSHKHRFYTPLGSMTLHWGIGQDRGKFHVRMKRMQGF